jgi:hypothetical protein
MKLLTMLTVATMLAAAVPASAVVKCPQPHGSVISVPGTMGCGGSTPAEDAQRRIDAANAGLSQYRLTPQQRAQGETIYTQAVDTCRAMVNRMPRVEGARTFKADAASAQTYGTDAARFEFEACMARQVE